ncbi:MAG: glycosyltransferase family 2 protein [Planctomycetota bacterium]|jgi:(heptosyl)LPS beta-1,4-glucosyltransferase|nr:glycosyltransferase family 2 protein [Planctomycetota bacterium]
MEPRLKITAQIIARNEEETLPACLAGLDWADEILLVDSFSTDRTAELARAAGGRVVQHEFADFSSQYNWGMERAAYEWIFIVDADEVVDPILGNALRRFKASEPEFEVYLVRRDAFFLGHRMRASSWSDDPLPRLFRKGCLSYRGLVHSTMDTGGRPAGRLEGRILHYSYRSLEQFFRKNSFYAGLWAADAFGRGRRAGLPGVFLRAGWAFFRNYLLRREFLDGKYGLLTASGSSVYTFEKYARLWDLGRKEGEAAGRLGTAKK